MALTPVARELQHAVEPALGMTERALRIQAFFAPAPRSLSEFASRKTSTRLVAIVR